MAALGRVIGSHFAIEAIADRQIRALLMEIGVLFLSGFLSPRERHAAARARAA